jgi:hypothetical protein
MSVMSNNEGQGQSNTTPILDHKLDARGRRQLSRGELAGDVELMVRTEFEVTSSEQETLCEAGLKVHFVSGNVLSGAVAAERLAEVAELPFVRRIEVSRALYPEDDSASE